MIEILLLQKLYAHLLLYLTYIQYILHAVYKLNIQNWNVLKNLIQL